MRTLKTAAVLLALAAGIPGGARAAAPVAGLRYQRAIYSDSADVALRHPEGIACDDKGALIVADTGNARLLTYTWKDGAISGGTQLKLAQLTYPVRVQIDSKGFVLALDRRTKKIVRLDGNGAFANYVESSSSPMLVTSFKVGPGDAVYALDVVAGKVFVLTSDGKVTKELALPKALGITDVAVDSTGRVYVVDAVTSTVFAADAGANSFQPLSKSLKDQIAFPTYLTADNRGKLYVVDQNGNAVVRLGVDGTFQGRELAMGWNEGYVYYPGQLCMNGEGDVFLADRNNNRVQVFSLPR